MNHTGNAYNHMWDKYTIHSQFDDASQTLLGTRPNPFMLIKPLPELWIRIVQVHLHPQCCSADRPLAIFHSFKLMLTLLNRSRSMTARVPRAFSLSTPLQEHLFGRAMTHVRFIPLYELFGKLI
jgi:hypothetical protein